MIALEAAAERWLDDVHPHPGHLRRARDWVLVLEPEAGPALRVSALLHDIERAFPDPESTWDGGRDWDNPGYLRWHQQRSADLVSQWLREQRAPSDLRADTERLIAAHEVGGWPEANLLQAADSLSFLETMVSVTIAWCRRGIPLERAEGKLSWMAQRIQVAGVEAEVTTLLERALAQLYDAARERPDG